jgi:hypothetical protein
LLKNDEIDRLSVTVISLKKGGMPNEEIDKARRRDISEKNQEHPLESRYLISRVVKSTSGDVFRYDSFEVRFSH